MSTDVDVDTLTDVGSYGSRTVGGVVADGGGFSGTNLSTNVDVDTLAGVDVEIRLCYSDCALGQCQNAQSNFFI